MKSKFAPSLFGAISFVSVLTAGLSVMQVQAGETVFYVTEDGKPVSDLAITLDGQKKLVRSNGFISFDIKDGDHQVEFSQLGEWAGDAEFTTSENQNAEVQVELVAGEALAEVNVFAESEMALGTLSGYLMSVETEAGIVGAQVSLSKELTTMTNQQGYFEFEVPRGAYEVIIDHKEYGQKKIRNLRVLANVATEVSVDLSMSGDGVIEEVVAIGTYVADSVTAQERDSSAVLDSIGSEQFARFGDSNAASALKRVAGVAISDGKYVVVRGLNERHTAVMLNGASLPSPDPSRRVVPLDIFPSSILNGIDVQKNFTADVYADSSGGAVKLATKKFPQEFEGKISTSVGYVDGLTLVNKEVQHSEGLDLLGFGSEGDRALPSNFNSAENSINQFPSNFGTQKTTIAPNTSIELSAGNTLVEDDAYSIGYTSSVKYSNEWAKQDRKSNSYIFEGGKLVSDDDYKEERISNNINLGAAISFGLIAGDHEFSSNSMILRQTLAENSIKKGTGGDQDQQSIGYKLGWYERQFLFQQFTGDHYLADILDTEIKWQGSFSQASLNAPDERSYTFERDPEENGLYALTWSQTGRVYNELTDSNTDFSTDLSSLMFATDAFEARLKYGASAFSRIRDAEGSRVGYKGDGGRSATAYAGAFLDGSDIDHIIDDASSKGDLITENKSAQADDYDATWDLTSYYLSTDLNMADYFNVLIGARSEKSNMTVNTVATGSSTPIKAIVKDDDIFPSISATLYLHEEVQLRAAYYQTKNRPDFRELASAQYVDPDSGDIYGGNPRLVSAEIDNMDVRAEWYFSDNESMSLAYFTKDFTNPISKTLRTGGDVFTFRNGSEGIISGFEFDFRKEIDFTDYSTFIAGNLSLIDSEVELEVDTVVKKQAMQGQADKLANLQLGLDHLETGVEATLVINHQGESLDTVAQGVLPNVMNEPRTEINFNIKKEIFDDSSMKLKLKNITDEKVQLTQGGKNYRSYHKGLEVSLGFSTNF
jgi:TonB-dependent receptor